MNSKFALAGCVAAVALAFSAASALAAAKITIVTPYHGAAGHPVLRRSVPGCREGERLDGQRRRHQGRHRRRRSAVSRTRSIRRSTRSSSTSNPAQVTAGLETAKKAGVPVFGMDAGASPLLVTNVTSNGYEMAADTAAYVVNRIGGKGGVVSSSSTRFRPSRCAASSPTRSSRTTPDIKMLDRVTPDVQDGGIANSRAKMEAILAAHPAEGRDRGGLGGVGPAGARRPAGDRGGGPRRRRHRHHRHGRQSAGARSDRQGRQFRGLDGAGLQGHRQDGRGDGASAISPARRSSRA